MLPSTHSMCFCAWPPLARRFWPIFSGLESIFNHHDCWYTIFLSIEQPLWGTERSCCIACRQLRSGPTSIRACDIYDTSRWCSLYCFHENPLVQDWLKNTTSWCQCMILSLLVVVLLCVGGLKKWFPKEHMVLPACNMRRVVHTMCTCRCTPVGGRLLIVQKTLQLTLFFFFMPQNCNFIFQGIVFPCLRSTNGVSSIVTCPPFPSG